MNAHPVECEGPIFSEAVKSTAKRDRLEAAGDIVRESHKELVLRTHSGDLHTYTKTRGSKGRAENGVRYERLVGTRAERVIVQPLAAGLVTRFQGAESGRRWSRVLDCQRYEECLDAACAADWNGFTCERCGICRLLIAANGEARA